MTLLHFPDYRDPPPEIVEDEPPLDGHYDHAAALKKTHTPGMPIETYPENATALEWLAAHDRNPDCINEGTEK